MEDTQHIQQHKFSIYFCKTPSLFLASEASGLGASGVCFEDRSANGSVQKLNTEPRSRGDRYRNRPEIPSRGAGLIPPWVVLLPVEQVSNEIELSPMHT